jgi:hypothetical protein
VNRNGRSALVFWSATALGGLIRGAICSSSTIRFPARRSDQALVLVTGHVLFAVVGSVVLGDQRSPWRSIPDERKRAGRYRHAGVHHGHPLDGILDRRRVSAPADPIPYAYGAYTLTAWARLRVWLTGTPGRPATRSALGGMNPPEPLSP